VNLLVFSLIKGAKIEVQLNELEKSKLEKFFVSIGSGSALNNTPTIIEILDLMKKMAIGLKPDENIFQHEIITFMRANLVAEIEIHVKMASILCVLRLETSGLQECYDYIVGRNE